MLRVCPFCNSKLTKDDREISPGVYGEVEVCPNCTKRPVAPTAERGERGYTLDLFKRRTFNLSGSIAIRLPREITTALGIGDGTEVKIEVSPDKAIVISKV